MAIKITKRLIGRQDIAFDTAGSNESFQFAGTSGRQVSVTKLNASHIPVTKTIRETISGVTIEDALIALYNLLSADNQAYETVAGVARVATEEEVRAGQNDEAFVTPKKLLRLLASATQTGLVRLATAKDIATGENPNSVLSVATASVLAYGLPAGTGPLPWYLSEAPAGFLLADGSTKQRAAYPHLWEAVKDIAAVNGNDKTKFTRGDGNTTFGMPDLQKVKLGNSVAVNWMFKA